MQRPILSGMVAMSGLVLLTFLRMDERCQQAKSAREEELAKKVQGAVSLLKGALYEGKIVSNNVKRRHLNSGQRAIAVAMMYPEARHAFTRAGMNVMLADIETSALDAAVSSLHALGSNARGVVCDVADPVSVDQAAQATFQAFGNVHVVCNNAGVAAAGWTDLITR